MGTRSSVGFIAKGNYSATYNQFDGYPDGVGQELANDLNSIISQGKLKEFQTAVENLKSVSDEVKPTKEEQEFYVENGLANLSVSEQSPEDWYCLLRNAQGGKTVELITEGTLKHLRDATDFIKDSLFCEWAYIINFDTMMLEVYKGFQSEPQIGNRFGATTDSEYYPCKLIAEYPFGENQPTMFDSDEVSNIANGEIDFDESKFKGLTVPKLES